MNSTFSTEALIKAIKSNPLVQNSSMPMGYVPGLPTLCILNGNLCMRVPFLKYKVTGEVDQTFVYPIRYLATVIVPEGIVASFDDLALNASFANVNFSSPVGKFRHQAIQHLDKPAYENLRADLYREYDSIVLGLTGNASLSADSEARFSKLLNILIEPSLIPFYKAIDPDFTNKYIAQ